MYCVSNELRMIERGPVTTFKQRSTFTWNAFRQCSHLDPAILTKVDCHSVEEDATWLKLMCPRIPEDDTTEPAMGALLPAL